MTKHVYIRDTEILLLESITKFKKKKVNNKI